MIKIYTNNKIFFQKIQKNHDYSGHLAIYRGNIQITFIQI